MTFRPILAAALMALPLASPAPAQGVFVPPPGSVIRDAAPLTGIRATIARELPRYGFRGVDVRRLSTNQVAAIHHHLYAGRSQRDTRGLIASSLGRGLLGRARR